MHHFFVPTPDLGRATLMFIGRRVVPHVLLANGQPTEPSTVMRAEALEPATG